MGGQGFGVFGTWSLAKPGGVRTIYASRVIIGVEENNEKDTDLGVRPDEEEPEERKEDHKGDWV